MVRRYLLYLFRWQLSTPILAVCVTAFAARFGGFWATAFANLVGGLIFFWVDRFIFSSRSGFPVWAVREEAACHDCGQVGRAYRLVKAPHYDRTKDPEPEYRCEPCSRNKACELEARGVVVTA